MGEKFKKVFSIPETQHANTAPVLIKSGALLKSDGSEKVFAQVSLYNISPLTVKSATDCITMYDETWTQIGEKVKKEFSNLNASRNTEFGSEQVIPIPEKNTHEISCECTEVVFSDGTIWNGKKAEYWQPLVVNQPSVAEKIEDVDLANQFVSDLQKMGVSGDRYPYEYEGLWYCSCGTQNTEYDATCHNCGVSKENLFAATDLTLLAEHRAEAIAEQEAEEQRLKEEKEKKKKKIKKGIYIGIASVAFVLLTIFFIIPFVKYSIADSNVKKGLYDEAIPYYEELGDFLSSEEHLGYAKALKTIHDGEEEKGIKDILGQGVAVSIAYSLDNGHFTNKTAKDSVQYATAGEFKSLEKAEKDYYDFHGWKSEGEVFNPKKGDIVELSLMADFTPTEYKINYITDGKITNPNPATYNYESKAITLKDPSREGYTFAGWTDEQDVSITGKVAIPEKSHGEKTFKASWTPNIYTITIVPGEEKAAKGSNFDKTVFEFTFDAEYSLPKAEKRGYKFLGWTDESGTYLDGTWQTAKNVTLKPSFELVTYTISYDLKGGELSKTNPDSYNLLTADISVNNPSRFGYKFIGWTWEDKSSATTTAVIASGSVGNKHLVAHWKGNPHTVTLNANGGSVSTGSYGVVFGDNYTLPIPVKTGYSFNGWFNGSTNYSSGTWKLDKDLSVTASWTAKKYNIRLDAAGGSGAAGSFTATYDSAFSLPTPSRRGYDFQGWYYGGTRFTSGTWKTDADITLSAHWQGKTYTITLNANGGSVSSSRVSVVFGDSYKLPTPSRKGYDFTGWSTSSYSTGSTYSSSGTWNTDSNVTLYAKWELAKYTLTINPNGGTYTGSRSMTMTYGSIIYSLYTPSRTGYDFDGWYYGSTKISSYDTYDYEEDITITARWSPKTYTVTLKPNGGSCSQYSYTFTYDEHYNLPTPTRDGYSFDGWYDSSYYGTYYSSSGTWTSTSNPYYLYAHWTLITTTP